MQGHKTGRRACVTAREPEKGRVWKLPPDKAAYLEKQFAEKGNVLIYEDGKFYNAEEWLRGVNAQE